MEGVVGGRGCGGSGRVCEEVGRGSGGECVEEGGWRKVGCAINRILI